MPWGASSATLTSKVMPLSFAIGVKVRSRNPTSCGDRNRLLFKPHGTRLNLCEVQDLVDEVQQILPDCSIVSANSCCFVVSGSSESVNRPARIKMLLSGVRNSCDMLARNSDL